LIRLLKEWLLRVGLLQELQLQPLLLLSSFPPASHVSSSPSPFSSRWVGVSMPRLRVAGALDTVAAADEEMPLQQKFNSILYSLPLVHTVSRDNKRDSF
jgi:hypothetical protein